MRRRTLIVLVCGFACLAGARARADGPADASALPDTAPAARVSFEVRLGSNLDRNAGPTMYDEAHACMDVVQGLAQAEVRTGEASERVADGPPCGGSGVVGLQGRLTVTPRGAAPRPPGPGEWCDVKTEWQLLPAGPPQTQYTSSHGDTLADACDNVVEGALALMIQGL